MGCTDSKPTASGQRKSQGTSGVGNNKTVKTPKAEQKVQVKEPAATTTKKKAQPIEDTIGSVYSDGGTVASPTIATPKLLVPGRMVLYYHPFSQPCRSVVWYMTYTKRDAFRQTVDLIAGEHRSSKYLSLKHCPQVPLLHDGDSTVIAESSAILQYLAQTKEPTETTMDNYTAFPPAPEPQAKINEYFAIHHKHVRKLTVEGFSPVFFAAPESRAAAMEEASKAVGPQLALWEKVLSERKCVVGDTVTVCDFLFVPEVDQLGAIGMLEGYPHIESYLSRMKALDGYEKASEEFYATLTTMGLKK